MPPVELHYERDGRGAPLLFLHGGGLSAAAHRHTRAELARCFDVIAPDARGHGKSPDPGETYSYKKMAGDVLALLDRLNLPKLHVVGFSDGAVIALELAISHPERVDRVILIGGNYLVEGLTEEALEKMREAGDPKLHEMWENEPDYSAEDLAKIRAPALIMIGDRDVIRIEHAAAMYRAIPGAQLNILPGAGHLLLWEQAERAHGTIVEFLQGTRPARSKTPAEKPLDVIVAGTGGVGSAALYHLAKRGARVLGIDRFPPGHARGSSHGDTRVIRLAYFEHPSYVPLLERAYELWDELSTLSGRSLIHRTGLIQIGPSGGALVKGLEDCRERYGLELDSFSGAELERRYPGFRAGEDTRVIYEKVGGYLDVEDCVVAHASHATAAGARLHIGETIRGLRFDAGSVTVETDKSEYRAAKLVLSPGPWAKDLLGDLGVELKVLRKPLFWFAPTSEVYDLDRGAPIFLFETPAGVYYGFPKLDPRGVKVAEHDGGDPVADPLRVDRTLHADDLARVETFLRESMPAAGRNTGHAVCMYTMTPDEHFLLGRHPDHPHLALAAGLSGHGFKFTSVLGEILADLTLSNQTAHPIAFLDPARFRKN